MILLLLVPKSPIFVSMYTSAFYGSAWVVQLKLNSPSITEYEENFGLIQLAHWSFSVSWYLIK